MRQPPGQPQENEEARTVEAGFSFRSFSREGRYADLGHLLPMLTSGQRWNPVYRPFLLGRPATCSLSQRRKVCNDLKCRPAGISGGSAGLAQRISEETEPQFPCRGKTAPIKTIFEPWQLRECLDNARQTEPFDPADYDDEETEPLPGQSWCGTTSMTTMQRCGAEVTGPSSASLPG
jgi:hypothetical protein